MLLALYAWTPTGVVAIPLRRRDGSPRSFAFVDEADAGLAEHRWFFCHGYALRNKTRSGGKAPASSIMHREIMGVTDPKVEVDHVNGFGCDNRRSNLRLTTRTENQQNKRRGWGSSRHRGVSRDKWTGRYRMNVTINGKRHYLGTHADEMEAARIVAEFRRVHTLS